MTRMLDLRNVFELVDECLRHSAVALQRRSSPELVSIIERLRAKSLSLKSIKRFFMLRRGLAKN